MIDAFKPEYLKYAPYLSLLTKNYQWGKLEMPAGHWGGVEIFFKGNSEKLALFHKKEKSSLKWIKHFSWAEKLPFGRTAIDVIINIPRVFRGYELFKTGNVPLRQLWKFDFCVKKPLNNFKNIEYKYIGELDETAHEQETKSKETIKTISGNKKARITFSTIDAPDSLPNCPPTLRQSLFCTQP